MAAPIELRSEGATVARGIGPATRALFGSLEPKAVETR